MVFNAQLTRQAKERLKALAQLEGTNAYSVLEEAFWERWHRLPREKRRAAELIASEIERARREQ